MLAQIPTVSKENLRHILINGCHLNLYQGKGKQGIRELIQRQGFIQLDPLNPAGRNHDIFCFSRLSEYSYREFETTLYPEKRVFEQYFHALNVISVKYLPYFYPLRTYEHLSSYYKNRIDNLTKQKSNIMEKVFEYVQNKGPVKSVDMKHFGSATQDMKIWKSSTKAGSILEFLWSLGKIAVVNRDEMFHKEYDVFDRQFNVSHLPTQIVSWTELYRHHFQIKLLSFPVQNAKFSITKSGKLTVPRSQKSWFHKLGWTLEELLEFSKSHDKSSDPTLVFCPEINRVLFVPRNWEQLSIPQFDGEMRAIAPLDPLIYDRDLTLQIFNFDYVWEIYKPVEDRKWGYYQYPLLWNGQLVGRWEVQWDKKKENLHFFNYIPEKKGKKPADFRKAMKKLIESWQKMLSAQTISQDASIPI